MFAKIENNAVTDTTTEDEVRRRAQDAGVFLARDFDEWGDWMRVLDEGAQPPEFHDTTSAIELVEGVPTTVYSYTLNAATIADNLAAYRWKVETGGITLNGVTVQTDVQSRTNLLGAKALGIGIKWKTPDGFIDLTAEQVATIAEAVGLHIQKCFAAEAALVGQSFESIAALEAAFDAEMGG